MSNDFLPVAKSKIDGILIHNIKSLVKTTKKTLSALLSGSHPLAKTYGGKQVFVVDNEIFPLRRGKKGLEDFKRLKTKYGKEPILTFVPHPGVSYILIFK